MKLLASQRLYICSPLNGDLLQVTAIFTDSDEANSYMTDHPGEAVIAAFREFIFLAATNDKGIEP